jgi:hypothetical protein
MYQMAIKIPNVRKIFQMTMKYIYIFQSKALQNLPALGFFVWKQTIWQPWYVCTYDDASHDTFHCLSSTHQFCWPGHLHGLFKGSLLAISEWMWHYLHTADMFFNVTRRHRNIW